MSEDWRVKEYYRTRVLISTDRVINPQLPASIVCLTGAHLEMLRNLTQYLHRRSTFVSEYGEHNYLAPSNEEWDIIQASVADLEEVLMGCEGIVEQLAIIADRLACVCRAGAPSTGMVEHFVTEGALQYEDGYGSSTVPVETDRCATAQLAWSFAWEFLTEIIQPAQDKAVDVLLPAAMVAIAVWVGTPLLGIPTGIVLALLWNVIELWVEGQLANVANGLYSAKEELVCAVYDGLGTNAAAAAAAAGDVISDLPGWSPIDILVGKLLFAPWVIDRCALAWDNQTSWATNNVEYGYCQMCLDPTEGSDWIAYPVIQPYGDVVQDHSTPGSYWVEDSVCGWMPDARVCGAVVEVVAETGDCSGGPCYTTEGCAGESVTQDASTNLTLGQEVYLCKQFTHNEAEAMAALCPGAVKRYEVRDALGPGEWKASFAYGWNCTGTRTVRVKWIVYEK